MTDCVFRKCAHPDDGQCAEQCAERGNMERAGVQQHVIDHCSRGPEYVVAVIITAGGEVIWNAIFSDFDKASAWSMQLPDPEDGPPIDGVIYIPKIIDMPEYGNVPTEQRN